MCEFHGCNGLGFGDIWWTDKLFYFSSIDDCLRECDRSTLVSIVKTNIHVIRSVDVAFAQIVVRIKNIIEISHAYVL